MPARTVRSARLEVTAGAIAAGGGCVARAAGRPCGVRPPRPARRAGGGPGDVGGHLVPPGRCRRGPRAVARPGGAPVPARRSRAVRWLRLAARLPPGPARPEGGPGRRAAAPAGRPGPRGGGRGGAGAPGRTGLADPGAGSPWTDRAVGLHRHRSARHRAGGALSDRHGRRWTTPGSAGPWRGARHARGAWPPRTAGGRWCSVETGRAGRRTARRSTPAWSCEGADPCGRPDRVRVRGGRPTGSRSVPACSGRSTRGPPPF